jgi:hypothetical protein
MFSYIEVQVFGIRKDTMSSSTRRTDDERLQRLQARKKALEAKISREQARVWEREGKARTRLLLAYGGLVDLAGLTQKDQGTVLGLLLEGAQRLQNLTVSAPGQTVARWDQGRRIPRRATWRSGSGAPKDFSGSASNQKTDGLSLAGSSSRTGPT